jgi:carboxylesterase type B
MQIKFLTSTALGTEYTANQTYVVPGANSSSPVPNADPRESEDCLFLDVFVPEKVMSKVGQGYAPLTPVLVWIYVSDAGFITIVRLANLIAGRRIYTRKQEH